MNGFAMGRRVHSFVKKSEGENMNKYIITSVCGDTYNVSTYDIVSCEENDLTQHLDRYYFGWRDSRFVKIFRVSSELDKSELS